MFRFDLVGRRVVDMQSDDEGLGISLEGDWSIAIFAGRTITCDGKFSEDAHSILGARLVQFTGSPDVEILTFDNGCEISVDLRSDVIELMVVNGPQNLTVVWN